MRQQRAGILLEIPGRARGGEFTQLGREFVQEFGMNQRWFSGLMVSMLLAGGVAAAQEVEIVVHADQVSHRVIRYLTGACIEDVNHEIYGGLYSQIIFGESFQEPPPALPLTGFTAYGGRWVAHDGAVWSSWGGLCLRCPCAAV